MIGAEVVLTKCRMCREREGLRLIMNLESKYVAKSAWNFFCIFQRALTCFTALRNNLRIYLKQNIAVFLSK